jgi:hypothetical protein
MATPSIDAEHARGVGCCLFVEGSKCVSIFVEAAVLLCCPSAGRARLDRFLLCKLGLGLTLNAFVFERDLS